MNRDKFLTPLQKGLWREAERRTLQYKREALAMSILKVWMEFAELIAGPAVRFLSKYIFRSKI